MPCRITRRAYDVLVAHAQQAVPDECCGILLGSGDLVVDAIPAHNDADQPATRFELNPGDHIAARRTARARGLAVVGFYHSHPATAATASPTDRREASYPDHLYLIVGLGSASPEVKGYTLRDGALVDTTLEIVPGAGAN